VRYMLRLAGPVVVSTLSCTLMQFVDRFMVSRLGTDALAAVLPAGFVSFLPGGFALGVITSLNTFVSQSVGRNARAECSSYSWQMIYLVLAYFLAVITVLWPAAPRIFQWMGQPASVAALEVVYLRLLLLAQAGSLVNWVSNQFFMGIHRPVITMVSALCGQVVNVVASYLLIFGKLGLPALGIAGAGWGTCAGIGVAALINISAFLSRPIQSEFQARDMWRPDLAQMRALLRVGLPAGVGLMVNVAVWGVVLYTLVGRFGKEALAATSAVLSCTHLSTMPIIGVGVALTAAVGKSIGAGNKERAVRQTRTCLHLGMVYMGSVGVCFFLLRGPLMAFWSTDPRVVEIGSRILVCAALYQVFYAARIIYDGALRGAGDTIWLALVSSAGAMGVLGLGGALTTWLFPSLGALGPWIIATLSIVTVGLANRRRFLCRRWTAIDLFQRPVLTVAVSGHPR
jgi:MATE family multidrug resistance protein